MSQLSILIVDDHPLVRKGLRMALESQTDMTVIGEAGTMHEAIEAALRLQPQIITLDLTMPGPSGVATVERLRSAAPGARIVIVTMHDDPAYVRSAVAMGAAGYVNKSAADTELVSAVRAVASGRVFIDVGHNGVVEPMMSRGSQNGRKPVDALSDREREVLRQVARGYTNQQIADEIGLSVKTVESYRARLMKKLGMKERADLVRLALEMGML